MGEGDRSYIHKNGLAQRVAKQAIYGEPSVYCFLLFYCSFVMCYLLITDFASVQEMGMLLLWLHRLS